MNVLTSGVLPTETLIQNRIVDNIIKDTGYDHATVVNIVSIILFSLGINMDKSSSQIEMLRKKINNMPLYKKNEFIDTLEEKIGIDNKNISFKKFIEECKYIRDEIEAVGKKADNLWNNQKYDEAYEVYKEAADLKDTGVIFFLAEKYRLGAVPNFSGNNAEEAF
jgi:hypothetical protein